MARDRYLTTMVDWDTFQAVIDAGNLWGTSRSTTAYKLLQRGLVSLENELGSKTPTHIKVARMHQTLSDQLTVRQRLQEAYQIAKKLEDQGSVQEIEEIAASLGIFLTE